MPNWATTSVRFAGSPDTISHLRSAVVTHGERKDFDFNVLRPMPAELGQRQSPLDVVFDPARLSALRDKEKATPETSRFLSPEQAKHLQDSYGAIDWYGWCVNNWGTKWIGSIYEIITDEPDVLALRMDTAWSEPDELFIYLDKKFDDLQILAGTIYEDGCEFAVSYGDSEAYLQHFTVCEETEREDDYEWTNRWIESR